MENLMPLKTYSPQHLAPCFCKVNLDQSQALLDGHRLVFGMESVNVWNSECQPNLEMSAFSPSRTVRFRVARRPVAW